MKYEDAFCCHSNAALVGFSCIRLTPTSLRISSMWRTSPFSALANRNKANGPWQKAYSAYSNPICFPNNASKAKLQKESKRRPSGNQWNGGPMTFARLRQSSPQRCAANRSDPGRSGSSPPAGSQSKHVFLAMDRNDFLVLRREWGNGMMLNSYYRSFPHSLY